MRKTVIISVLIAQLIFFPLLPFWLQLANYLHPLVIAVVWFCITSLVLFVGCLVRKVKIFVPKRLFQGVILLYTIGLLVLLFFRPGGQSYGDINLVPFETVLFYFSGQVDFLIAFYNLSANVGLFLPFGLYYRYVAEKPTIGKMLMYSIVSVAIIETTQFLTKRGSLDIDDLLLNVSGVLLGYLIFPLIEKVLVIRKGDKQDV